MICVYSDGNKMLSASVRISGLTSMMTHWKGELEHIQPHQAPPSLHTLIAQSSSPPQPLPPRRTGRGLGVEGVLVEDHHLGPWRGQGWELGDLWMDLCCLQSITAWSLSSSTPAKTTGVSAWLHGVVWCNLWQYCKIPRLLCAIAYLLVFLLVTSWEN